MKLFIFDKASGKDKLIDWCLVRDPFPEGWHVPVTITERYGKPKKRAGGRFEKQRDLPFKD